MVLRHHGRILSLGGGIIGAWMLTKTPAQVVPRRGFFFPIQERAGRGPRAVHPFSPFARSSIAFTGTGFFPVHLCFFFSPISSAGVFAGDLVSGMAIRAPALLQTGSHPR